MDDGDAGRYDHHDRTVMLEGERGSGGGMQTELN